MLLALHRLRDGDHAGDGRPLLLLHELGGAAPSVVPAEVAAWPGPIHALDFSGHGESSLAVGGGYHPEILMADADVALAHLGEATIVGWGIGGYVGLQLAGGRAEQVRGAIVADGRGLDGVPEPGPTHVAPPPSLPAPSTTPDPIALLEMEGDVRPPDYVAMFVDLAADRSQLDDPISIAATARPAWLAAVLERPGVVVRGVAESLERYRQA